MPIALAGLGQLRLFRPHVLDLLLTKMMRGVDPIDLADAEFLIGRGTITAEDFDTAIDGARVPDVIEIRELFDVAKPAVRSLIEKKRSDDRGSDLSE